MEKSELKSNKIYYDTEFDRQIKFIEEQRDGYYLFEIINDPVWYQFETKDLGTISSKKREIVRSVEVNKINSL